MFKRWLSRVVRWWRPSKPLPSTASFPITLCKDGSQTSEAVDKLLAEHHQGVLDFMRGTASRRIQSDAIARLKMQVHVNGQHTAEGAD